MLRMSSMTSSAGLERINALGAYLLSACKEDEHLIAVKPGG